MPHLPRPIPSTRLLRRPRLLPVAAAAALAAGGALAQGEMPAGSGLQLRQADTLQAPPRGDSGAKLPIIVRGREIRGRPDLETVVDGDAEFRRGGLLIRADRLEYDQAEDLATARGNVRIERDGNRYSGPEMQLRVQRFEGFFDQPTYFFGRTGAGGRAQRIDFLDEDRAVAVGATYSSCTPDGGGAPDWLLETDRVRMDFAANEGIAEGAVLRFLGVPILGAPVLSFPLTDARKSGWLPPSINLDSKSGLQFSIPYYWNIAPNRDATITPEVSAKRGVGSAFEFRYLEPRYSGTTALHLLPNDRLTGRARHALDVVHDASFAGDTRLRIDALRVSDDAYWKDFPRAIDSLTPRLLSSDVQLSRPFGDDWSAYARVQRWQVLQDADPTARIEAPYERAPQVGLRWQPRLMHGFEWRFETEANRFVDPTNGTSAPRPTGSRWHALGSLARPWVTPGWSVVPKLSFNAASYALDQPLADGRRSASRVIPSFSVDSAWTLERDATWFGRGVRQTLEPRLLYVNTPYRDQSALPNFDAAAKDFNFESIFTDNAFSGIDRVSDAHQLTAGVTTRILEPGSGSELLRLGLVQRYRFRPQRTALENDPQTQAVEDAAPLTQRFSDLLLLGSTSLVPHWTLDASVQYSPDQQRTVRSILGARYSPGPFRTVSLTYRLARGLSEQVELAWQWPIYGPARTREPSLAGSGGNGDCRGSWYGVGRVNYSTRDSRIVDSIAGLEYDAGCWIGRVVAERLSTGRSEATTRLLLQLELVGLSRLGSNPLQVLKDNIPGYRLLREDRGDIPRTTPYE